MLTPLTIIDPRWFRGLSGILALYALIGGAISLSGWVFDMPRLTDWLDSGISIQPNTALLLIFAGIAGLLLLYNRHRRWLLVLASIIAIVGALNLLQYLIGVDLGFNHQLLFGRTWGGASTVSPGRFGPPASVSFIIIGLSFALLSSSHSYSHRFVPGLALVVVLITMFSLLGYLFGARNFYEIPWLSAIAMQTASMLLALAVSLVLSVPQHHPMLLLTERSSAGNMARTVLPTLIVMIPLFIWLRTKGYEYGWYDLGASRAIGAAMLLLGVLSLMWIALLALRRREMSERNADQRKDEFLAILAHELRNPLAPLSNATSILKLSSNNPSAADRALNMIERQTAYMVRLVDDLLDLSRISNGKLELRRERVELSSVIKHAMETCSSLAEAADQKICIDMPSQPIYLNADPVRLSQVVCNLLNNASKFSARQQQIHLVVERHDETVAIRIKDNGTGIPQDMLSYIFEMFSQVDRSLEKAQGGLGIGLTLASRLVQLHDGSIKAYSDGPGKGSEFVVELPLSSNQHQPLISPESATQETAACCILIADDNVDSANSLAEILTLLGNETFVAHDGEQAVAMAEAQLPDFILLDIGMPKMNGYDACRRLRTFPWGENVLIFALTGWGQENDRRKSAEAGFDGHIVKPVNITELKQLLASRTPKVSAGCTASEPCSTDVLT